MIDSFDIAGFDVTLEGHSAILRFATGDDPDSEPGTELEQCFKAEFQDGGRLAGKDAVIALEDMPALSSRQLGALMSIQRASGTGRKLTIRGARRNVRELFVLTKMNEFFDY